MGVDDTWEVVGKLGASRRTASTAPAIFWVAPSLVLWQLGSR